MLSTSLFLFGMKQYPSCSPGRLLFSGLVFLLLSSGRSVFANLITTYPDENSRIDFNEDQVVTCVGRVPFDEPVVTLAQWCWDGPDARCFQRENERGLFLWQIEFQALGEISYNNLVRNPVDLAAGETRSDYLARNGIFATLVEAAEICRIKCRCDHSGYGGRYANTASPDGTTALDSPEKIRQWDFDGHRFTYVNREVNQEGYGLGGLDTETALDIWERYSAVPDSAPYCSGQPPSASDLAIIHTATFTREYANYQKLCTHRYVGGDDFTNMGGVCLLGSDGLRHLTFPYPYIAPEFTLDDQDHRWAYRTLQMQRICQAQCLCEEPRPELDLRSLSTVVDVSAFSKGILNTRPRVDG